MLEPSLYRRRNTVLDISCRVRLSSYLRQVNEVNGGDNAFVRCVCVCRCVCLCVRSGRSWELNANRSKMVKATDFKFDTLFPSDSSDMITKNFPKRRHGHGHVTP